MSARRIYVVRIRVDQTTLPGVALRRLVRASSAAQAFGHVARNLITAHVADQEALVAMLRDGVEVEDAGTPATRPTLPSNGERHAL